MRALGRLSVIAAASGLAVLVTVALAVALGAAGCHAPALRVGVRAATAACPDVPAGCHAPAATCEPYLCFCPRVCRDAGTPRWARLWARPGGCVCG